MARNEPTPAELRERLQSIHDELSLVLEFKHLLDSNYLRLGAKEAHYSLGMFMELEERHNPDAPTLR